MIICDAFPVRILHNYMGGDKEGLVRKTKKRSPLTWSRHFPDARGSRQSPIDINPEASQYDEALSESPIIVNYLPIAGGPLGGYEYQLTQFHLHWGPDDTSGSEHTYKGKKYPTEIHFVHYNKELYATFEEGVGAPDGLAVIGIFVETNNKKNQSFEPLSFASMFIKRKNKTWKTGEDFNPASLLPDTLTNYWTYNGSLTTPPPLCEKVRWIIPQLRISVTSDQLQPFRKICSDVHGRHVITNNYREPLPLFGRKISASFKYWEDAEDAEDA
ncbi:LOW QUALITY PROTEIN: carbonic anhydrase 2-like [Physella acuta]|uniref:LOW QUALITY PROTEIN: carbonic anhydrase 2-like n=1 Tax=Physella acuta TaxID=109671 RepID=UPI0027DE6B22|nr:LOW QUALITY PROTEIN: carbonic anhydrase 2-like [Physella acuta]